MEDSKATHIEDVEHAREREAHVHDVFRSLEKIASESRSKAEGDVDRDALVQASQTIACNAGDLIGLLRRIEEPGERGDMFGLVADILEATFEIGRFGAASQSAFDLAKRSHQSAAAQGRVRKRQAAAQVWRAFCQKRAVECRLAQPGMTTDDLAEIVRDGLPVGKNRPGLSAITKHIRALVRAGDVPPKRKS